MTQAQEWRAFVTWRQPPDPTTGQLDTLTRALPGFGIVADDRGAGTVRAEMTVEAPTLRQATEAALRAARTAYGQAFGAAGEPIALRVLTVEDYDAESAHPGEVELMGLTEAAAELGVSPQRVDQLAREHPQFPAPVARLAAGPVFTAASIRAVRERGWRRRPGRPRKAA